MQHDKKKKEKKTRVKSHATPKHISVALIQATQKHAIIPAWSFIHARQKHSSMVMQPKKNKTAWPLTQPEKHISMRSCNTIIIPGIKQCQQSHQRGLLRPSNKNKQNIKKKTHAHTQTRLLLRPLATPPQHHHHHQPPPPLLLPPNPTPSPPPNPTPTPNPNPHLLKKRLPLLLFRHSHLYNPTSNAQHYPYLQPHPSTSIPQP